MSLIVVSEELLSESKNFLDITWTDKDTDEKLKGQIRRGIAYITEKTGVPASDFSGESVNDRAKSCSLIICYIHARALSISSFRTTPSS